MATKGILANGLNGTMPPAWCPLRSFPGLCRSPRSTGSPGVRYSPCRKRATTIAALTGSLEASRTADPAPPQPAKGWAEELLLTERGSGGGAPQSGADRCSLSPPSPCRGRVGNFWCPVTTYENTVLWLAPSGSMVSALLQVCGLAVDHRDRHSVSSLGGSPLRIAAAASSGTISQPPWPSGVAACRVRISTPGRSSHAASC